MGTVRYARKATHGVRFRQNDDVEKHTGTTKMTTLRTLEAPAGTSDEGLHLGVAGLYSRQTFAARAALRSGAACVYRAVNAAVVWPPRANRSANVAPALPQFVRAECRRS